MMKIIKNYCWLLPMIALFSCKKEIRLKDPGSGRKIVLLGELIAGDTVQLRAGQSAPVTGNAGKLLPAREMAMNISGSTGIFPLPYHNDGREGFLFTSLYSQPGLIINPGTYTIEAGDAAIGAVSCTVNVPEPFEASITDTAAVVYDGKPALELSIRISDRPGRSRYVFEAVKQAGYVDSLFVYNGVEHSYMTNWQLYDSLKSAGVTLHLRADTLYTPIYTRLNVMTEDQRTANRRLPLHGLRRVLLDDGSFEGKVTDLRLLVDRKEFVSELSKGKVVIRVRSVSEAYYQYLLAYELLQDAQQGISFEQPVLLESNVKNGLGIVGGVYEQRFDFLFDKW